MSASGIAGLRSHDDHGGAEDHGGTRMNDGNGHPNTKNLDSHGSAEMTTDIADVLAKLNDLDRVLPRSIEDWVADRDRDGLDVPEILKTRLAEKARLRRIYRDSLRTPESQVEPGDAASD